MKPVATFNLHDDAPVIHEQVPRPSKWLVNIWIKGIVKTPSPGADPTQPEKEVARLPSQVNCMLSEMLDAAATEIAEMMDQFTEIHDGGFTVLKLR